MWIAIRSELKQLTLIGCLFHLVYFSVSCTNNQKSPPPSLGQYKEDTNLMLNVANKFVVEHDVKKLHEVAVATQQTRVMACFDYNHECQLYGELINLVISASADGVVSPFERNEIANKLSMLQSAINEGISKLQKDLTQ